MPVLAPSGEADDRAGRPGFGLRRLLVAATPAGPSGQPRQGRRHLGAQIAGGVGANLQLRARLSGRAPDRSAQVFYPELEFCTDNGAMIAFAAAKRLEADPRVTTRESRRENGSFTVRPRWNLETPAAS